MGTEPTEIRVDWNKILPTVWHRNAFDTRLYLFISPSGMTHIAKWAREIGDPFNRENEYLTLCNRKFTVYNPKTKKSTGWRRPDPFYDLIQNPEPDGFLDVTCPRCAKLKPKFFEPFIEIDHRPHWTVAKTLEEAHRHGDDGFSNDIIPKVLRDQLQRCETCSRVCRDDEIKRRRRNILEYWHYGHQPRACENWQAGVYAEMQKAMKLTDEQIRKMPIARLELIYNHLTTHIWEHETDTGFQARIVKELDRRTKGGDS